MKKPTTKINTVFTPLHKPPSVSQCGLPSIVLFFPQVIDLYLLKSYVERPRYLTVCPFSDV